MGKRRFSLEHVSVDPKAILSADKDGSFIDDAFLNGDPVYAVYQDPDGVWIHTPHPQTIHNYAYADRLAIVGEDPHLYGHVFVPRTDLFLDRFQAQEEANLRNAKQTPNRLSTQTCEQTCSLPLPTIEIGPP